MQHRPLGGQRLARRSALVGGTALGIGTDDARMRDGGVHDGRIIAEERRKISSRVSR